MTRKWLILTASRRGFFEKTQRFWIKHILGERAFRKHWAFNINLKITQKWLILTASRRHLLEKTRRFWMEHILGGRAFPKHWAFIINPKITRKWLILTASTRHLFEKTPRGAFLCGNPSLDPSQLFIKASPLVAIHQDLNNHLPVIAITGGQSMAIWIISANSCDYLPGSQDLLQLLICKPLLDQTLHCRTYVHWNSTSSHAICFTLQGTECSLACSSLQQC